MKEKNKYKEVFAVSLSTLGLLAISLSAFSKKTHKIILERDKYQSVISGKKGKLETAHIDHSKKNPNYNDPSNGRTLTIKEHYLDHYNRHGRNGITKNQNIWALKMIWNRLSEKEKKEVNTPNSLLYKEKHN